LGDAALDRRESWDLGLTASERNAARAALAGWPGAGRYLVMGTGTKIAAKDWGEANWARTAQGIARPGWGLVLIGSADEAPRAEAVARAWGGPALNLCGALAPRVSAAVIEGARLFVGHDSGPMHLAAAAGVPVVAVFSARAKPGVWFPHGANHAVLYHRTACFGCELTVCVERAMACLKGIAPDAAIEAARARMDAAERAS
jgi:ADP-heptose:LPS heptosyltransferase